ncbi:MAG: hypothetical protein U9N57_02470 [Pseudomonadota bacterium]|nr:hypothetical protein [Pseudomonadota bacterium]
MAIHCPSCGSQFVTAKHLAKKAGGSLGLCVGGTAGILSAINGARSGALIGAFAGPAGITIGTIGGALAAGLAGAASAGIAGAKVGEQIDSKILLNYQCNDCCHSFSNADMSNTEEK